MDTTIIARVVTVNEAARWLHVSERHLWRLIASGRVRTVRLGGRTVRVPLSEIERLCERGVAAPDTGVEVG